MRLPAEGPTTLADVSEAELVDLMRRAYARTGSCGVGIGIGDDAAVVTAPDGMVVATTDTMVRDQDWRDDWSSGADVGRKIVTQNVADVAAMGAVPTSLLVTLVADPGTPLAWVDDLVHGIAEAAVGYRVPVVGGDLSGAPAGFASVSVTALGDLEGRAPVTRAGARPGDIVAVGGGLGRSGAGLLLFLRGETSGGGPACDAVRRYHRAPRMNAPSGPWAAEAGATSMIDVSDGLSRDAGRIASASGIRVELDRDALVTGFCGDPVGEALGMPDALEQVLHGGEEHSLLATFPAGTDLSGDPGCRWTIIGRVAQGEDVTLDGEPLRTKAWDHFSG